MIWKQLYLVKKILSIIKNIITTTGEKTPKNEMILYLEKKKRSNFSLFSKEYLYLSHPLQL